MDDLSLLTHTFDNQEPAHMANTWLADLSLVFEAKNGRSYLAKRQHTGPLVIQKSLHPEGQARCHGIIVHPPGGVAGGDVLRLAVDVRAHAQALLTTPGAGKWYKANGLVASQHLQFSVAEQATLEWFPQENIVFDGASLAFSAEIQLAEQATFAGWDIVCFGRLAKGEHWHTGMLKQRLSIRRNQKLIWHEAANLKADQPFFTAAVGLSSQVVSGTFLIAAGALPPALLTQCQTLTLDLTQDPEAQYGISALPEVVCARYIGMSTQSARHYFEALWHILRPWYADCAAIRPRIWNT